jgi:hypothetical protein
MRKLFVYLGSGLLTVSLNSIFLSANASVLQSSHLDRIHRDIALTEADQSPLIKQNKALLIANGNLARKIAAKLDIAVPAAVPTSGTPLEQNLSLILQNQEIFKAIATKVGAVVPELGAVDGADQAEKNHKTLLQNKSIVVGILNKLGIPPAPQTKLTGTFVDKNHTLLVGNGKAMAKIAAKLGVK